MGDLKAASVDLAQLEEELAEGVLGERPGVAGVSISLFFCVYTEFQQRPKI